MKNIFTSHLLIDFKKQDTLMLKGIAIIMIYLHNFCHVFPGCIMENEFRHRTNLFIDWINNVLQGGPHILINFFSFWGHYGVPIFLFLSGFGLVRKYESANSPELSVKPFMKNHIFKLWKLMFAGVLLHVLVTGDLLNVWIPMLFTLIPNLIPHAKYVYPQWWFFSLIMQFYLLYALFLYRKPNNRLFLFTFLSLFILVLMFNIVTPYDHMRYIRLNVTGWVLSFAVGAYAARKKLSVPLWMCLASLVVFVLCEINDYTWLLGPFFLFFALAPLTKIRIHWLRCVLEFMGKISAPIFVLHPIIRSFFIDPHAKVYEGNVYLALLAYSAITIILAYSVHLILKKIG